MAKQKEHNRCDLSYLCLTVTHAIMRPEAPTNTPMMPIITPMTIPITRGVLVLVQLSVSEIKVTPVVDECHCFKVILTSIHHDYYNMQGNSSSKFDYIMYLLLTSK